MIPRILHQFWCNLNPPDTPPDDVFAVIAKTRRRTQGWQRHLWSCSSVEKIMEKYPDYLKIFRRLQIPAMKSDLARILVLYEFGGLYLDATCFPRNDNSAEKFVSEGSPSWVAAESQ